MSVAIYNLYLSTLGGGERSTLAFARALRDITRQEVVVYALASAHTIPQYLEKAFGINLEGVSFATESTPEALTKKLHRGKHEMFLNHTYNSRLPNPAPVGFYAMMFPVRAEANDFLLSYDRIFCNSDFCGQYTSLYYPAVSDRVRVMYPPIANRHVGVDLDAKDWNLAVNIGRFSYSGHSKKQFELATAMRSINEELTLPMRLRCFGRITQQSYFDHCLTLADESIEFTANVSESELGDWLSTAGMYIHGCGLGLDYGMDPHLCEHFGLATLEAMSAGCIPFAVGRGGAVEYIRHGVNGFLYDSVEELACLLRIFSAMPVATKIQLSGQAMATAAQFSHAAFHQRLTKSLRRPHRYAPSNNEVGYV